MNKLKTSSTAKKRFRITNNKKVMFRFNPIHNTLKRTKRSLTRSKKDSILSKHFTKKVIKLFH